MLVEFTLDGKSCHVEAEETASALQVLREDCGRTDILSGCAPQGICGTCMVLVNDKPRLLCTLRAKNIHKKNIQTLADISMETKAGLLTQFSSCAATPCGYCAPALLLKASSIAQYPLAREEKKKALQMHLCRCASWTQILDALEESEAVASVYSGEEQWRMLGKTAMVADMRQPGMIFAKPVFAPHAHFEVHDIVTTYSVWPCATSTSSAGDICALIYSDEPWYRQETAVIQGNVLDRAPVVVVSQCEGDDILHDSIKGMDIDIPFVDPGMLEPEAVFVDWLNKKTFVSGQDPHALLSFAVLDHPIYSLPGAANFGGVLTGALVRLAQQLAQQQNKTVLLMLDISDAFRIRPKRPAVQATAHIASNGEELSLEASFDIGSSISEEAEPIWKQFYAHPYHWKKKQIRYSCTQSDGIPTSLQRGMALEGLIAARECALDRFAWHTKSEPFSVRSSLLSTEYAQRLWASQETYRMLLSAHRHVGLAIATTPLGVGQKESVEVTILVRNPGRVEIFTGFWSPFIHNQMKTLVGERTGIDKNAISVICSTEFSSRSGAGIADRDRWLGLCAVEDAAEALARALVPLSDVSLLVGQCFVGKAEFLPSEALPFAGWGFAVGMAGLSEEGDVERVVVHADIGNETNMVWAKGHISGAAQMGFSVAMGEGFSYDGNGLPPTLLQKMGIAKVRNSPQIDVDMSPSNSCVPFADASFCATYAAICVAKQRRVL